MKLRYFIPTLLLAVVAMFTSCSEDDVLGGLDGIKVSSNTVSLPLEGGSATVTVNTAGDWTVEVPDTTATWLTAEKTDASTLTLSAPAVSNGHNTLVKITSGAQIQYIKVIQGVAKVTEATVAEVLAGPESATYRVTGTVTKIANTHYGNFYMNDGTSDTDLYIYGTVDAAGSYNWAKFGIDVGDEVTVEGPKSVYKGEVELVDAAFISVKKSLLKLDSTYVGTDSTNVLPIEGGDLTAYFTNKGEGITFTDLPDWLGVKSIKQDGTKSVVTLHAAANPGGDREATVTFKTTKDGKEYSGQLTVVQKGAIVKATIAEFNAAEENSTQYRLTGVVTEVKKSQFTLSDYTGETVVYKAEGFSGKVGDIVTCVGKRGSYKTTIEMVSGKVESTIACTAVTVAEFNGKPDGGDAYYLVSGTITKIDNEQYGNLYIKDDTGELFVYGVYGYGANLTGNKADKQNFLATKGLKEGDKVTLVGTKTTYKGTIELNGGIFVSKE